MNRFATAFIAPLFAFAILAGCTTLSDEDRALLDQVQVTSEEAKAAAAAAEEAARAAQESAAASAAAAEQSAADAAAAAEKADRIFRQLQRK